MFHIFVPVPNAPRRYLLAFLSLLREMRGLRCTEDGRCASPEPYILLARVRGNIEIQSFRQLCVAAVIIAALCPPTGSFFGLVRSVNIIFYWLCLRLAGVPLLSLGRLVWTPTVVHVFPSSLRGIAGFCTITRNSPTMIRVLMNVRSVWRNGRIYLKL